jgi:hypothetical protein
MLIGPSEPSIKSCSEKADWPLTLEALYALLRRLRLRLDRLRTGLFAIGPPPAHSGLRDPFRHALEHLSMLLGANPCPLSAFSLRTQRCWLL